MTHRLKKRTYDSIIIAKTGRNVTLEFLRYGTEKNVSYFVM